MSTQVRQLKSLDEIYGSEFLSPDDIPQGKKITVIIQLADWQHFPEAICKGRKIPAHDRVTLQCNTPAGQKCRAKLAVNKTSMRRLRDAWGEDYKKWEGKTITIERGLVDGKKAVLLAATGAKAQAEVPDELEATSEKQ
jgi:hypothetical protein